MGTINVKVHPIFVIFSFIVIYIGKWALFSMYLVAILCHEFGHYLMAKILSYNFHSVVFMPYGVGIGSEQYLKHRDEMLIAFSGPMVSILLGLMTIAIWWIYPLSYAYTYEFASINFILGLFNLLPILPMDGGRIYVNLFSKKYQVWVKNIFNIIAMLSGVFLLEMFLISIFYQINVNFLFMSFFLFSSLDMVNTRIFFDKFSDLSQKDLPLKCNAIAIEKDIKIHKLLKYIESNKYTIFYVVDKGKVLKTYTESEIINMVHQNEINKH